MTPRNGPVHPHPIDTILPQLSSALQNHSAVVLHAPPGAGKTTRVPIALLGDMPADGGRIVMLEPRRIAAVAAARWMAAMLNEEPGQTVGYAIRFDARRSERTRIEVVTEGILTRRIQSDPALEGTAIVIFDEFHERSIHADLALALCLDIRRGLRPDLKVLIMSATLDCGPVAALLGGAPVVSSGGRIFPVQVTYAEGQPGPLNARITSAVRTAIRETSGDILVFLPGAGEIRNCAAALKESFRTADDRTEIHPLYGDLPFEQQERAILPARDRRKIVLATNIAETSLTIEGVHVVIDSGLTRMLRYDPATGMNRLVTLPVSRASAEQRTGRAGRLGPGACYRLYSRQAFQDMLPFSPPEIMVADLSQLVLELAVWGVRDPATLSWLDMPPAAAWDSALRLLRELHALDESGSITRTGRSMVRMPLHPRLSRLIIRAGELKCTRLGTDLAAILTERDLFRGGGAERMIGLPDVAERVEAVRWARTGGEAGTRAGFDRAALRSVERTAMHLFRLTGDAPDMPASVSVDHDVVSRLLLAAYPDRICKRRDEGGGRFVHLHGRGVRISPDNPLVSSPYIIAVAVDAGEQSEGFVHIAAPVTEDQIRSECSDRIRTIRRVEWDRKENRIVAAIEERIETLLLTSRPFTPEDDEAAPILCDAVRADPDLIRLSREARQMQARAELLRRAFPEEPWPDLSDERLFGDPETWLCQWFGKIRSGQGLRGLNVVPALRALLTWEQQRTLDERAPIVLAVPSGSRIVIDYTAGDQPVLAVKLQEMFGCADTPTIASGRVRVLLHLLSPARRPVQITQDLKGFWNTGYAEVKKDLKGRYPKHPWPDDPWNAVPTRRTMTHKKETKKRPA